MQTARNTKNSGSLYPAVYSGTNFIQCFSSYSWSGGSLGMLECSTKSRYICKVYLSIVTSYDPSITFLSDRGFISGWMLSSILHKCARKTRENHSLESQDTEARDSRE